MTDDDLKALLPNLELFHSRFGRYFRRSEGRLWSQKYLTGLALPIERKNVENIAEQVGAPPRKLQEFLSDSPWDDRGCIAELQRFVAEQFGAPDGVLIVDDTGFAKKGIHSAGVGRQYSGTLGRTENCQIGVFLGYATRHGHTLVDCRLYMTEAWFGAASAERHRRAAIPTELGFKTRHELGLEMLQELGHRSELPYQWVTADAAYGDSHQMRNAVAEQGKWYCFEVNRKAEVWTATPDWRLPAQRPGRGRPRTRPHPSADSPTAVTVAEALQALPPPAWLRHRVTEGAKGPREYEFARLRVVEKRGGAPGPTGWLMGRRPVGASPDAEVKYYLSNAPESIALTEMAWVGCLRWTVEENFELAKGEVGLDHYEVTKYRGWYHHITMSLLALAFLKSVQFEWGKKWGRGFGARSASAA
jgi:SRSO17 transposase